MATDNYETERVFAEAIRQFGKVPHFGRRPVPSRLPEFVDSVPELHAERGGGNLLEQWEKVPARFFENEDKNLIDYDITDEMLADYSRQFKELGELIEAKMKMLRTLHQMAWKKGTIHDPTARTEPDFQDESYFAIQWTVWPVCRGPKEEACGCGCG